MAACLLADTDARRVITISAIGRGAAGADPFISALVAPFLFCEPFLQLLHDLVPAAQFLDFCLFLFGEKFLRNKPQPFFRDSDVFCIVHQLQALENMAKDRIKFVEIALVLHQCGAREVVKILHLARCQIAIQRFQQHQVFLQRNRNAGGFQFMEEGGEHLRGAIVVKAGRALSAVSIDQWIKTGQSGQS